MEQQTRKHESVKVYYDMGSGAMSSGNIIRLFVKSGVGTEPGKLVIKPNRENFEVKGKVDSTRTKDMVLSLVKSNHPYRDIIDHITIEQQTHTAA